MQNRLTELIYQRQDCGLVHNSKGQDFVTYNVDLAAHLITNGVTIPKWIPVTQRLPEYSDGHVLVTDGEQVKISCRNAFYKTAMGETRCAQGYGAGMYVTHWMPLPQPPREGTP